MTERLFVLGASDPEMEAIQLLLSGRTVTYAAAAEGRRLRPANAYQAVSTMSPVRCRLCECTAAEIAADPYRLAGGSLSGCGDMHEFPDLVLVECSMPVDLALALAVTAPQPTVTVIDHHRAGDPGFGMAPADFMTASSLGQMIAYLCDRGLLPGQSAGAARGSFYMWGDRWVFGSPASDGEPLIYSVPDNHVLIAAADHCLGAAYRGECPGVDPDALMRWRAVDRAAFQQRPIDALMRDIETTGAALRCAPSICMEHGVTIADMRRDPPWPELPEAATRLGIGYVSGPLAEPDGRKKFTVSGTPEQVRVWMLHWAPENGLTGIYGDPVRGFAGGYEAGWYAAQAAKAYSERLQRRARA